jgi:hypothetical protein
VPRFEYIFAKESEHIHLYGVQNYKENASGSTPKNGNSAIFGCESCRTSLASHLDYAILYEPDCQLFV